MEYWTQWMEILHHPCPPKLGNYVKVVCFWTKLQGDILCWESGGLGEEGSQFILSKILAPVVFLVIPWTDFHKIQIANCQLLVFKFENHFLGCVRVMLKKKSTIYVARCLGRGLRSHVKPDISYLPRWTKSKVLGDSYSFISLIVNLKFDRHALSILH